MSLLLGRPSTAAPGNSRKKPGSAGGKKATGSARPATARSTARGGLGSANSEDNDAKKDRSKEKLQKELAPFGEGIGSFVIFS